MLQLQKRILQLAWPIMLSNITVPLLGLVDTAVLGHLDDVVYLGAVALGSQVITLLLWSFGFLRMGTTSLSAHATGVAQTQTDRTERILQNGLLMALMISVPLMILAFASIEHIIALLVAALRYKNLPQSMPISVLWGRQRY